jgi:hypothetical protein
MKSSGVRIGIIGAIVTIVGTLLSGYSKKKSEW